MDAWSRAGRGLGATVVAFGVLPLRIDYIYADSAFSVRETRVPAVDCSDHRPVVTDVVLY